MSPDAYLREVIALRDRCDFLSERVKALEALLANPCAGMLPTEWHLTPQEAKLTAILADLGTASNNVILGRLWEEGFAEANAVKVLVCKLRKKLSRHGIEIITRWGHGYEMAPQSREIVWAALS